MVPPRLEKTVRRLVEHLAPANDLTLVVLKGHLLVEQELNEILRVLVPEPTRLEEAKLSFWRLCRVVRAHVGRDTPDWVWPGLDTLNTLRNRLAHKLAPDDIERLSEEFLAEINAPEELCRAFNLVVLPDRLKVGIAYLCAALAGLKHAYDGPDAT